MNTTEKEEKTTNRKVEDKVSNTLDNFQPQKIDGFSKSKLEHICTIWRKSAQKKSDKKFKVIFFNSMYSVPLQNYSKNWCSWWHAVFFL